MKWQSFKYNFISGIRRFLYGRNGIDQLSVAIMALSFAAGIIAQLVRLPWIQAVYYAGLAVFFYRILSKNLYRRQRENQWFLSKMHGASAFLKLRQKMFRERKSYRYLKCADCKQRLRVPKGKGKIEITCSKCGGSFIKKV